MALRYNEAQKGGYEEKKGFVEYFLCNGPELDTDTIMYYREKAYQDPVYLAIAEIEFANVEIVDELRVTKYGKENDLSDCFTQPCNYLGPLSSTIGLQGDANNFRTMPNIFSVLLAKCQKDKDDEDKKNKTKTEEEKKKEEEEKKKEESKSATEKAQDKKKEDAKKQGEDSMKDVVTAWGYIKVHLMNLLLPDVRSNAQAVYDSMYDHAERFAKECVKAGITTSADIGDPHCIARADQVSAASKVKIYNQLGDCGRLWEHMRRFSPYDKDQNAKGPIPDSKLEANRNVNGTSIDNTSPPSMMSKVPATTLNTAAAVGNKTAQQEKGLRESMYFIEQSAASMLLDTTIPEDTRFTFANTYFADQWDLHYPLVGTIFEDKTKSSENYKLRKSEFLKIIEMLNSKRQQTTDIKQKPASQKEEEAKQKEASTILPAGTTISDNTNKSLIAITKDWESKNPWEENVDDLDIVTKSQLEGLDSSATGLDVRLPSDAPNILKETEDWFNTTEEKYRKQSEALKKKAEERKNNGSMSLLDATDYMQGMSDALNYGSAAPFKPSDD